MKTQNTTANAQGAEGKHTKGEFYRGVRGNVIYSKDANSGMKIVVTADDGDVAELDAKRIVKAVNSFEAMQSALKIAMDILTVGDYPTTANDERFQQIQKALKASQD